jgi:hypothetical protein
MAASILNSDRAIAMSIYVIRAFVELRDRFTANAAILKRLAEIDHNLLLHARRYETFTKSCNRCSLHRGNQNVGKSDFLLRRTDAAASSSQIRATPIPLLGDKLR